MKEKQPHVGKTSDETDFDSPWPIERGCSSFDCHWKKNQMSDIFEKGYFQSDILELTSCQGCRWTSTSFNVH